MKKRPWLAHFLIKGLRMVYFITYFYSKSELYFTRLNHSGSDCCTDRGVGASYTKGSAVCIQSLAIFNTDE